MTKKYFNDMFKKYYNDVYNFSFSYLHDKDLAKDIVQETFIRFYNNPPKKSDSTKFWLFKVCKTYAKIF